MSECDNPSGAGNQQERSILSPEFLAGLIVGEGSYYISIQRYRRDEPNERIYLNPGFALRMNDVEIVDRVCESFVAHGLYLYRNPTIYKNCVGVDVVGPEKMRKHLDFFLPLLAGNKLRAAQEVSDFTDRRLRNNNRTFCEEDVLSVERLREINGPNGTRLPIEILRDYTLRPHRRKSKG